MKTILLVSFLQDTNPGDLGTIISIQTTALITILALLCLSLYKSYKQRKRIQELEEKLKQS